MMPRRRGRRNAASCSNKAVWLRPFSYGKKLLFEPKSEIMQVWRSGEEVNAAVCKTAIRRCESDLRLQKETFPESSHAYLLTLRVIFGYTTPNAQRLSL